MSEYDQQQYIMDELGKREYGLKERRRYIPIIIGDEDDRIKAGWGLAVGGIAAALIEFGLAYYCFAEIFHLGIWISASAALILTLCLPLGFKMSIDHYYNKAQNAATAVMHSKHNLFLLISKEKMRKVERQQYYTIKLGLILMGTGLFITGAVAFTFERAWLETTDQDKLSWLSFIYNSFPMLGAAILSAVGFHHRTKRNAEVNRIEEIDEELEQIRARRLELLYELQENKYEIQSESTKTPRSEPIVGRMDFGNFSPDTIARSASAESDGHRNRLD